MDFDCAAASPGSQWMGGESASRRRQQRRLSSPSLRTYLEPAFDAAAGGDGVVPGSAASSYSSGGLDLEFDASLLRYHRTRFSASPELEHRRLLYSPPTPMQPRPVYPVANNDVLSARGYPYCSKRQAGGLTGAPGFPDPKHQFSNSTRVPVDIRSPEVTIPAGKAEPIWTPKSEATPSAQATSAHAQSIEEENDLITAVLYGNGDRRRLPVFKDICPE